MALPDLIEIVPLDKPVHAEITVPGSKSITNRALILAALADGEVTLNGALWSEDTQIMVECLQKLGFEIRVENDPDEFCNRTITVKGLGGKIPNSGTVEKPLELFVGNAGTAARFLSAFVCLGNGVYRLSGVSRMHERPQAALFRAVRELGYHVISERESDKLPARIYGSGPRRGRDVSAENLPVVVVSVSQSSQFASALLLCSNAGGWKVHWVGANDAELPYVEMTARLAQEFPFQGGHFQIEPDASSASYVWGAKWIIELMFNLNLSEKDFSIMGWEKISTWQIDSNFPEILFHLTKNKNAKVEVVQQQDLGDSIMTSIVLSPLFPKYSKFAILRSLRIPFFSKERNFTKLGRLRVQETERVKALYDELKKCGAIVEEDKANDTLTVWPSQLHSAEIETYNDHRMAMCFAILGLKVPGIKIKNPACVKKTFPNFFQKLAAPPPKGLGAEIRDAKTGRKLTHEELFAD